MIQPETQTQPHFREAGLQRNFQKPHFRDAWLVPSHAEPHQDPESTLSGEAQSSGQDPLVRAVGMFVVESAERVQNVASVGREFLEKVERSSYKVDEAVDRRLVQVHQKIDKLFGFFFREEDGSPTHPYANNAAPWQQPPAQGSGHTDVAVDDPGIKTGNVAAKPTPGQNPDAPESKPVAREKLATYIERTREGFSRAADFLRSDWQVPVVEHSQRGEARTADDEEESSETQPTQNIVQRGSAFLRKIGNDIQKSPRTRIPMAEFAKGPDGTILALGFRHTSHYWRDREQLTSNSSEVHGV